MDNVINLSPSPRALHFEIVRLWKRNFFYLACSLACIAGFALLAKLLIPQSSYAFLVPQRYVALFSLVVITGIVVVYAFLTESYKAMRTAKRLRGMITPLKNWEFKIDKSTKMIYTVEDKYVKVLHYDLIMKVSLVGPSSRFLAKKRVMSIIVKYLEFLPFPDGTDDVRFGVVRFDYLENAEELAKRIVEGALSVKDIRDRLTTEA